jgi:hypothetical protein
MRTITRTGVTLSVIAALVLYGVQLVAALGAAVGVVIVGALAGLAVAKWLERDWYGRQLEAGARAGAIACGVGGLSALLYLLGQGPRTLPELAARSHLPGLDLAPLVMALGPLGWAGVDVVVILGAILAGAIVSALVTQNVGWSKSGKAVRVVAQARLAAQALQRVEARGAATAGPRSITSGPQLYATGAPAIAPVQGPSEWEGLGLPAAAPPASPRTWRATAKEASPPPPRPADHRPSDARATGEALTEEARIALSNWESELEADDQLDEDSEATRKNRAPNPSAFLNLPSPEKPRKRKRQDTGDWLC